MEKDFSYLQSSELDFPIKLAIENAEDLIQISIIQASKEVEKVKSNSSLVIFNTKFKDLTNDSLCKFVIFKKSTRAIEPAFYGMLPFFDDKSTLRQSMHKITLYPVGTPLPVNFGHDGDMLDGRNIKERDRLDALMRDYHCGDIPKVDWLDEKVMASYKATPVDALHIYVKLPIFNFPVIFKEKEYSAPDLIYLREFNDPVAIFDSELLRENPVENKHRRLARSHRTGFFDRELKPNAKVRDELNIILRYPPTKYLSDYEKDLLWKFRFYLTREKKALTKFVKCVMWDENVESKQAAELLAMWVEIDVEDALELLCPEFTDSNVRKFAVEQLKRADDQELQLYLLQLVQAIKFEPKSNSTLVQFLIARGVQSHCLGNYLHWYLMVECQDKSFGRMYGKVAFQFLSALIQTPAGITFRDNLRRQGELVATLADLGQEFRVSKDSRQKKIERLREFIGDRRNGLLSFPPIFLPLDPTVQVIGIVPEMASVFKSALLPFHLTFTLVDGSEYPVIFKTGDDLRQDQVVIQTITLMNRLLLKENLDLRLTPYKVLATGINHGMVQFVPSKPIAAILAENNGSLIPYLAVPGTTQIEKSVMETYIRSNAGYCIMTYLLGVGDRHLDNLLITKEGALFHIDFGYILGRDPKPFPPKMKLSKEMIEVFGNTFSNNYSDFQSFAFIAFNNLRKSANLILNLFALMVDSDIPDLSLEPDKTVRKVLERFRLDLNDEEANQYIQTMIDESVGAYFPQVMEQLHKVAQMFRS